MRVVVQNHYDFSDAASRSFEGDEVEVRQELLAAHPWLRHKFGPHAKVEILVEALNRSQGFSAETVHGDIILKTEPSETNLAAMMGYDHEIERAMEAARFMADAQPADNHARRQALFQADGDVRRAALLAHGLEADQPHLRALEAILVASKATSDTSTSAIPASFTMRKAEEAYNTPKEVTEVTESSKTFAEAVQRSIAVDKVHPVELGGKHSAGSMVAIDPRDHRRYLLKPGAGEQPPAAGADESGASQSKREAGMWAVADQWGLGKDLPETHLLLLDGREYAAMQLLGSEYRTALQAEQKDHGYVRRLFHMRRPDGQLHRWGTLDYVLGNSDRHAQNVMVRGEQVQLIDHGSALAGLEFSPATDQFTFVPYYLRVLSPPNFNEMSPTEKLRHMPRLHPNAAKEFGEWLHALDGDMLAETLHRYGIEAKPAVGRLKSLQAATSHSAPDLVVLQAWILP